MISVIHNHGTSFKGLMAYLMHDADHATTSERVAWTETYNLATDDPELGWKTMAATAMSQAELKAEAGIKNTGRKSSKHVMHYTLSWHDEERKALTRDEMIQAALASMTYIGTHEGERLGKNKKTGKAKEALRTQYADEHQAVIVCHDEANKSPHVHIMLNRVNPRTGVFLPDSMDYEKLSAWALEYRKAQGKDHYCPQRQKNAAKRAQGLMTSHRRKSRTAYETEQEQQAADPGSRKAAFLESQRKRAGELMAKKAVMTKQHTVVIHELEDQHIQSEKQERRKTAEQIRAAMAKIKAGFAPKIDTLTERQQQELQTFKDAKATARGRVRNAWAALKTKQWMTDIRTRPLHATTKAFKLAFDSGLQQRDIEKHHEKETRALTAERRKAERESASEARAQEYGRLKKRRQGYETSRNDLIFKQDMERAKLKAEWHQLQKNRAAIPIDDERAHQAKQYQHQEDRKKRPTQDQPSPDPSHASEKKSPSIAQPSPDIQRDFEQAAGHPKEQDHTDTESEDARKRREFTERQQRKQEQRREQDRDHDGHGR